MEGTALEIASSLQIAYMNGSAVVQWTRSPRTNDTNTVVFSGSVGDVGGRNCSDTYGSRPAFTLPSTVKVAYDGSVVI